MRAGHKELRAIARLCAGWMQEGQHDGALTDVVMFDVVESGRERGYGNADANAP